MDIIESIAKDAEHVVDQYAPYIDVKIAPPKRLHQEPKKIPPPKKEGLLARVMRCFAACCGPVEK